jgi:hypothetical protein
MTEKEYKIALASKGLTDKSKSQLNIYYCIAIVVTLVLWVIDWQLLAAIVYFLAIAHSINIYSIEVAHNDNIDNKIYLRKLITSLVYIAFIAIFVVLILHGPWKALFLICATLSFTRTIAIHESFDKEQNLDHMGNYVSFFDGFNILNKTFHIKTLLIPMVIVVLGLMLYGIFIK